MSYSYERMRRELFTDKGILVILIVHTKILGMNIGDLKTIEQIIGGIPGDYWVTLAAVDYLIKHGVLREIQQRDDVPAQHRIIQRNR